MRGIWDEIRTDCESGARRLVAEYGNRLYAAALLLCRNAEDAEELVFRTFERAVSRIGQYEPKGEFFSWLYVIMLNEVVYISQNIYNVYVSSFQVIKT